MGLISHGIRNQKQVNDKLYTYFTENDKIIFEQNDSNVIYYMRDKEGNLIVLRLNGMTYFYVKNIQEDIIGPNVI